MTLEQLAKQGRRTETFTTAATINSNIFQARKANLRDSFMDCEHIKHRNEIVETRNGVNFIDDSGAKSVSATYFTLSETTTPSIWLTIGGCEDYEELIPVVRQCVVAIICIGNDFENINRSFGGVVRGGVKYAENMAEALKMTENISVSGQNVIFSPAGKSVEMNDDELASDFVKFARNK